MSFDSQIASLEKALRQLRIEFDRYVAGAARVPPEEMRFRLEQRIRRMREGRFRSFAERFRLSTLEASFNTLNELHGRRLRDIEHGKNPGPKRAPGPSAADASKGFVLGKADNREALEALYSKLYSAAGRQARADFGSFEKHVARQISKLQAKTGCQKVHLRVAQEGDTLKLKAKPVRKEI